MNNFIVNPWVFYWIDVLNSLDIFFIIFGIFFIVGGIFFHRWSIDENNLMWARRWFIIFIVGLVFLIISLFLPNKLVMYKMLASKYVTQDVAMKGLTYINDIVKQLLEAISK